MFQIRRIRVRICHTITACSVKLSCSCMEKDIPHNTSFRASLAHYYLLYSPSHSSQKKTLRSLYSCLLMSLCTKHQIGRHIPVLFVNIIQTSHTQCNGSFSGTTRKVKPIWILLKQETASGSGISWAICKSASRSRQITMPSPHHSVFLCQLALCRNG